MSAPANVIQIKERRSMDNNKQASRDYFEYKRLLRKVLSPTEYVIFEILCDAANEQNDGWCWPNLDTICEAAGNMGRATVVKALANLEKQGLIQTQHAPRVPGNQKPNYYKPMAKPEGSILETLTATWFKKRTTRATTKYSSSKTELRKISSSSKTELRDKTPDSSSISGSVVVQKLNSNVSKEENVYKKEKEGKQVAPPQSEKQPVSPDALTAYNLYCKLFKRACSNREWFDSQIKVFGRKAVLAAIQICYDKQLKSAAQLRTVLEKQTPAELTEFDDNGQRISKPKPPQKSATYPASSRFTPVEQLKRERNSTRIYD